MGTRLKKIVVIIPRNGNGTMSKVEEIIKSVSAETIYVTRIIGSRKHGLLLMDEPDKLVKVIDELSRLERENKIRILDLTAIPSDEFKA